MPRLTRHLNFILKIDNLNWHPESLAATGEATAPELYQWQANAQGGQKFGNQQTIQSLAEQDYQKHVRPLLRVGYADRLADYQKLHPEHTHISFIKKSDSQKLIPGIPFTGSLNQLRPQPSSQAVIKGWVKQVSSFDSPEATGHGTAAANGL